MKSSNLITESEDFVVLISSEIHKEKKNARKTQDIYVKCVNFYG